MAKKVKMDLVAMEEYVALRGIEVDSNFDTTDPKDMEGAVKAIEEWVVAEDKKQKKDNKGYYCNTCGDKKTTRTVLHDDVFCWFCGADVTADDNGGIEVYLKTKAASGDPVESAEPVEGADPVETVEPVEGKHTTRPCTRKTVHKPVVVAAPFVPDRPRTDMLIVVFWIWAKCK